MAPCCWGLGLLERTGLSALSYVRETKQSWAGLEDRTHTPELRNWGLLDSEGTRNVAGRVVSQPCLRGLHWGGWWRDSQIHASACLALGSDLESKRRALCPSLWQIGIIWRTSSLKNMLWAQGDRKDPGVGTVGNWRWADGMWSLQTLSWGCWRDLERGAMKTGLVSCPGGQALVIDQ